MGLADFQRIGSYNVICDTCGRKRKIEDCRMQWNGLLVCQYPCWEARNQQEFVRGIPDDPTVENARPEAGNVFVSQGTSITPPVIPASNTPVVNDKGASCVVTVVGGTVSQILVNGTFFGQTSGDVTLSPNDSITLIYTVAPTWTWVKL